MAERDDHKRILAALEEYAADLDATFAPAAFVAWVREHRPDLHEAVGELALMEFASRLISDAVQGVER